jgi:hypothetical protein
MHPFRRSIRSSGEHFNSWLAVPRQTPFAHPTIIVPPSKSAAVPTLQPNTFRRSAHAHNDATLHQREFAKATAHHNP